MPAAERLLREHPEADLIYAHNDRMAIGAAEAARKLGRNDIRIIGIDAAPSIGIKAVLDSVIDATFLYPPEGQRVVNTALNILKGKDFKRNEVLPATSAVDLTNADILQLQDETLAHETSKIRILKEQVDDYWSKHTVQTILFYTLLAFLLMIFVFLFLTLKAYWIRKKNQAILEDQNHELEKQRDLQKKLNEQLNEATQSKLMFFTNVSHDLRTPLTLIAEPVEQLQKAGNLTPQQQTLMKIADKNVKILKRLINQILDFRKYENGKLKLNLTETDLVECVREWIDAFRALARKRDIKIIVDLPDEPIQMAIDGEKFERVFFNLVSNAFKYTPDNGTIRLSLRKEGDKAIFRLSDTGEGISKEDLGHIFDRFFQVDRVRPKGSGIGLSLTKAFVELHDGTISVESEKGKGTEFTVTLKIRHVEGTEARKYESTITDEDVTAELENIVSTADTSDESKPLVLVIDDNADMLRLISELMSDTYRIITAPDGKEGVRLAAKYVPDAVICDVMMPVMDGLECCRLIKDEVSTSHIPVLMLTACSMDEQKVQGFDSGADGYISKPFNSGVLRSNIDSLIANRRTIRNLWLSGNERISRRLTGDSDRQSPAKAPVASPAGDIDSDFYRRFLEIFEKEMGNADLNIEHIASQMGLGHSQFYRKIKALTNYTPVELMRRLRLEKARTLLTTEKAISEIAYEVGFSTPAYFTKCYRTAFGETPTELRERLGAR